jgi:hypothetical protein
MQNLSRGLSSSTLTLLLILTACSGSSSSPTTPQSSSSSTVTNWIVTQRFLSVTGPDNCWVKYQRGSLTGAVFSGPSDVCKSFRRFRRCDHAGE